MSSYYTVTIRINAGLDDEQAGVFSALFGEEALSASCKKDKAGWDFLWTWEGPPDTDAMLCALTEAAVESGLEAAIIGTPAIEELDENRDWLAESYHALPPFSVGPFFIYGSHYAGPLPDGEIPLMIEAATAFGSGEHGTTSRCLLAIDHVKKSGFTPKNILDMGCGSGILAIGAAKLWPDIPIEAADNDPECVRVTLRHIEANKAATITAYQSEGYEAQSPVWNNAPFDFIIANILAAPLIDMAQSQAKALADGGYLILSGMLQEQAARVEAAYAAQGLVLEAGFPGDEWMTLLLVKKKA